MGSNPEGLVPPQQLRQVGTVCDSGLGQLWQKILEEEYECGLCTPQGQQSLQGSPKTGSLIPSFPLADDRLSSCLEEVTAFTYFYDDKIYSA